MNIRLSPLVFEQIHCGTRDANPTGYSKTLAYRADTSQTPSSRMLGPSTNLRFDDCCVGAQTADQGSICIIIRR